MNKPNDGAQSVEAVRWSAWLDFLDDIDTLKALHQTQAMTSKDDEVRSYHEGKAEAYEFVIMEANRVIEKSNI